MEASAIADINRDSGAKVFARLVSEEFDIALHEALLTDLPEGTIRFLGTAAEQSSGLVVLQLLVHPRVTPAHSRLCNSLSHTQHA